LRQQSAPETDLAVVLEGDERLRMLNREYRQQDLATDVLSFPAICERSNGLAGDVAISAEIAAANAHRLGHTAAEEIKILALHAILHLAGYDHARDDGEMAVKEAHLRRTLNLPAGLIERDSQVQQARKSVAANNPRRSQSETRRTSKRVTRASR
jgi:probable rRNA maturation factor